MTLFRYTISFSLTGEFFNGDILYGSGIIFSMVDFYDVPQLLSVHILRHTLLL